MAMETSYKTAHTPPTSTCVAASVVSSNPVPWMCRKVPPSVPPDDGVTSVTSVSHKVHSQSTGKMGHNTIEICIGMP